MASDGSDSGVGARVGVVVIVDEVEVGDGRCCNVYGLDESMMGEIVYGEIFPAPAM